MSFLAIEGLHAFVTGAQGGIGSTIVKELVANGCKVTAHDLRAPGPNALAGPNIFNVSGDISKEASISQSIHEAVSHFGPINILCANAGITNEQDHPNIWEMPLETWENVYRVNVQGCFLTIKHFLLAAIKAQEAAGEELANLSIVVTGSECGKFGQAGHSEYASGKAALQYGIVPTVKNEIVRINSKARINAIAPGWVNTDLIGDRLDDPKELYLEAQGTAALRKIAQPEDVARTVAFLVSHRASGHMSGQCLSVDGGMEGRILWREEEVKGTKAWGNKADAALS
ncbi:Putative short-chain dehydrogenase/reductase SDR, NAD(P)-binding domain superfamily [Septoria linicola]|uniref:Short-chain dehydrogenase/reductase SDR, NAD(P)-binding domain superfamily n=1 Tax=Septoria linicola TaxID=215465 RepID=A0A9Q9EQ60_9PEZI|nr:Putative short-chain dehydrogenase/reductase SDR, NAD(P)-binding domain superfamily [Septoria linicola]